MMEAWGDHSPFLTCLAKFMEAIQLWNKSCFGNIFHQKKSLFRRIQGIQASLEQQYNQNLRNLEIQLLQELKNTCLQEEVFWKFKTRDNWLALGDRNSVFFHRSTIIKHSKQRVLSLLDNSGNRVLDPLQLKRIAINFFKNLYREDITSSQLQCKVNFKALHPSATEGLMSLPTAIEIFKIVKGPNAYKAPDLTAYLHYFFKVNGVSSRIP